MSALEAAQTYSGIGLCGRSRLAGQLLTPEGNTSTLKEGGDLNSCESRKDLEIVEQETATEILGADEDLCL